MSRPRNYGSMADSKLQRCLRELEAGEGEAYDRAMVAELDPGEELQRCRKVAADRGLVDGTATTQQVAERAVAAKMPKPKEPEADVQLAAPIAMTSSKGVDLRPMLCYGAQTVPEGADWFMEPKLDGWRWMVHVTAYGPVSYGGRNGSNYTGQALQIEQALDPQKVPPGLLLDGELVADGEGLKSGDVSSALSHGGRLRFVVFDVLWVMGHDVRSESWESRRALLEKAAALWDDEFVQLSKPMPASHEAYEAMVAAGGEGVVAKKRGSRYRSGARSRDWIKVKATETAEAVVTGFKISKSESYSGQITSFEVKLVDNEAETSVALIDEEMQRAVNGDPNVWLGQVIEFKHFGLGKTGVPRSPIMLRTRPDRKEA